MADPVAADLARAGVREVRSQAPLAPLTTLRVGGPARVLVTAQSDADLAAVGTVCLTHQLPWCILGRGSNVLVPDTGWHGVAVLLGRGFRDFSDTGDGFRAGAAEPLPALAMRVADAGYTGFAWAAAVPGTVGGAVRMNAGAHGGSIADCLREADVFRLRLGVRETWTASALGFAYRSSQLPDDGVVVAAEFGLSHGDEDAVRAEIAEIRAWRRAHQPLNQPNCGSVFTNPPGDAAGRLIEHAGCKGMAVGGASVSTRHANFVVTEPGTSASDVANLIRQVQEKVAEQTGVRLATEVVFLRDDQPAAGGESQGDPGG